ncbi:MAG: glycine/sarcosine/betaine reductase selenoprotein B family protein [Pseudomonadota bacterium]
MQDPLLYLPRIRAYYKALGYGAPYVWAQQTDVPLVRLKKPLTEARIGVVTTTAPFRPDIGVDQSIGAPVTGKTKFKTVLSHPVDPTPDLRLNHVAYDTTHTTHADPRTYNPVDTLKALQNDGVIAGLGPRVHSVPTNRSQATTRDEYGAEVIARIREDGVDAVVLVPICPVCHQAMALIATGLEAAGMPTVIMGAARDIVEHVGAPRLFWSNMPLGNPCGPPDDTASQKDSALRALTTLVDAVAPRTTVASDHQWPGDPNWQQHYSNAAILSASEIAERRAAFDANKPKANRLDQ